MTSEQRLGSTFASIFDTSASKEEILEVRGADFDTGFELYGHQRDGVSVQGYVFCPDHLSLCFISTYCSPASLLVQRLCPSLP